MLHRARLAVVHRPLHRNGTPDDAHGIALTEDADDLDEAVAHDLARAIRCPSLVIHGDEDAIAPVAWGKELARIAGSELHVIPGGGHEPELREAAETNRLLDDFLGCYWPTTQ